MWKPTRRSSVVPTFILLAALVACAPPPTVKTSAGKTAHGANQAVTAIGMLQEAAAAANETINPDTGQPLLSTSATRDVMRFSLNALEILDKTPQGWRSSLMAAYRELRTVLDDDARQKLQRPLAAVDAALVLLGGAL